MALPCNPAGMAVTAPLVSQVGPLAGCVVKVVPSQAQNAFADASEVMTIPLAFHCAATGKNPPVKKVLATLDTVVVAAVSVRTCVAVPSEKNRIANGLFTPLCTML